MKKRALAILLALVLCMSLLPVPVFAADVTVTEIVPCKYDYISTFSEGLACVTMKSGGYSHKYGFIDKTGREVIPCQYDGASDFSDGLAAVKLNDAWGFIDKSGNEVLPFKYDYAESFSEGLAEVELNDAWGFIDKSGNEVVPFKYDRAYSFYEGLAAVELNDAWGFIDKSGNEVAPFKYDRVESFSDGLAWVYIRDSDDSDVGKWGLIDTTGNEVVPCIFDDYMNYAGWRLHAYHFSEGLAPVLVGFSAYSYIDKTGNFVIPVKYDDAYSFSEGLALVSTGEDLEGTRKWGFIDKTGCEVIPCKYESAHYFSEGLASVKLNDKWGFIDKTGREVIPCKYEYATGFSGGLAQVELNDKWGLIDKTGKIVATLKYDYFSVGDISEGFATVRMNGKYGLISVSGGESEDVSKITVHDGKSIQSLFSKSSLEYDDDLALFAAHLSQAAEDEEDEIGTGNKILSYYRWLGWPEEDRDIYQYDGDRAYSIACAKLSKDVNLLVITARGSQTWSEFFEDGFSFGHRDFFGYKTNDVIFDFERDIMSGLNEFLEKHKYLMENDLKILITGHSLGGAAANLTAARFTKFEDSRAWWFDLTEQSDIYCYTFGAINSLSDNHTVKNGFENIHNVYNSLDSFGPKRGGPFMLSGLGGGYGKFGHMELYEHNYETDLYVLFADSTNHQIENYINSLTEGYVSCKRNSPFFSHGGGAWCPVDLKIYLETTDGSVLVGSITDNKIDEIEHPMVGLRVDGDKKYFYLPDDGNYTIELTGTDSGVMTYFVQDMNLETGEPVGDPEIEYRQVQLTADKQFYSGVKVEGDSVSGVFTNEVPLYVLDENGNPEKEVLPDGKGTEVPYTGLPFFDVSEDAWYYEAVRFVFENNLMSGYGKGIFAPNANLSRAMLAQILYNKENCPAEDGGSPFTDVADDAWYSDAVTWAEKQGIVSGYGNGLFGPNDNITREQLTVMLWRYEGEPAANVELSFSDADQISGFAQTAVCWAVENRILSGKGNNILDPKGLATRAETAQMLKNYLDN